MRLYFEVRFYTGLRTGEVNGLRLRDLDLPRNAWH
jgi:integrase